MGYEDKLSKLSRSSSSSDGGGRGAGGGGGKGKKTTPPGAKRGSPPEGGTGSEGEAGEGDDSRRKRPRTGKKYVVQKSCHSIVFVMVIISLACLECSEFHTSLPAPYQPVRQASM